MRASAGAARPAGGRGEGAVAAALFLCLFAGQAGLIAMSPVIVDVAGDLDVSTAAAGQLRTVAGLAAGITALAFGRLLHGRFGLDRLLVGGAGVLAAGSILSAAAPSFAVLALAQVPVGVGVAVLTTAGTVAAAEWTSPASRARVLSWALVGQPAAWIVGMPAIGWIGGDSWRLAWLVLPLASALVAGAVVARRGDERGPATGPSPLSAVFADRAIARWLVSECFANTAWAGTLVYSGALFVESYDASTSLTGVVLALGAGAYVAGNLSGRKVVGGESRKLLVVLSGALALATALFGACRLSLPASTVIFAAAAFAAGIRTLVSSAYGLAAVPEMRASVLGVRAATMQIGYVAGAALAGIALATGGYAALGAVIGANFALAALVLLPWRASLVVPAPGASHRPAASRPSL
jgi:DHA1 family inner membrane transport protein